MHWLIHYAAEEKSGRAELVRGKTGVYGALISLLTSRRQPLPTTKTIETEPLFDTVKTLQDCLRAFVDMLPHIEPNRTVMRNAALKGFATATDLADYLVRQDVLFAMHHIVGKLVGIAIERQVDLADLDHPPCRQCRQNWRRCL